MKQKRNNYFISIVIIFSMFLLGKLQQLKAQDSNDNLSYNLIVPIPQPGGNIITTITGPAFHILVLYNFAISIAAIAAFVMIVIAGFLWVTSAGQPKQISKAKDLIFNAVFGLLLLLSSWVILKTISPDLTTLKEPVVEAPLIGNLSKDVLCTQYKVSKCEDYTDVVCQALGSSPNPVTGEDDVYICEGNPCKVRGPCQWTWGWQGLPTEWRICGINVMSGICYTKK